MIIITKILNFLNTNSNAIIALSVMITAIFDVYGINEWKRQMKGKKNYEIARRYLKALLQLRDAIKFVRNPYISIDETQSALKKYGECKGNDEELAVYLLRWEKMVKAQTNLEAESLEAEISWGSSAVEVREPLDNLVKELYFVIISLFGNLKIYEDENSNGFSQERKNDQMKNCEVIYEHFKIDRNENIFSIKIANAIEKIKNFLGPFL